MPNILFASNNSSHFLNSNTSGESVTFDGNRVPYSIVLAYGETIVSPEFTPTGGNISWLHWRMYFDTFEYQRDADLLRGFDVNGNLLFKLDHQFGVNDFLVRITLYKDSGTSTITSTFPFNKDIINSVDIRYESTGSLTKVGLYVNGGLAGEVEVAESVAFGQLTHFSLATAFLKTPGTMRVSELLVADGDTRNARLDLLRPTASGGETDWVGAALDLADDDPTTGMTSIAANERQTFQLGAYTGASNISSVVVATQALAGANGPQNLRHTIRLSSVNYDGPSDLPLDAALTFHSTDFQTNPATSLPWVGGDLATMEMGMLSKT